MKTEFTLIFCPREPLTITKNSWKWPKPLCYCNVFNSQQILILNEVPLSGKISRKKLCHQHLFINSKSFSFLWSFLSLSWKCHDFVDVLTMTSQAAKGRSGKSQEGVSSRWLRFKHILRQNVGDYYVPLFPHMKPLDTCVKLLGATDIKICAWGILHEKVCAWGQCAT